ncbi:MAG: glycoside hydrolase family 15 protein [Nanoarchaeota archaeon]|nr:glycoside hydrolase family 15 protein [Nanoarchaeota archaeon]
MTRPIILGNGNMLVCLDKHNRIRDFYYPYVGQENHVSSKRHMTGVYVDGKFSWLSEDNWDLSIKYRGQTMVSEVTAHNSELQIGLTINETVHPEKNVLLRRVNIENRGENKRDIKLFFSSHFVISETRIGDTVYFDPISKSIINYKGRRYFLMGGMHEEKPFTEYSTGNTQVDGKEGTWKDCEDGNLSKNNIEHGAVDSALGFIVTLDPHQTKCVDYWICVGKNHNEVVSLKEDICKTGVENMIRETKDHWRSWIHTKPVEFHHLGDPIKDLFFRSLFIVKAQTDKGGAILAANDTHTFRYKNDTYSYMWPRDGALVARSLDKVGHHEITGRFFKFCSELICKDGYLLHKYRPDGSYGSSWHSWLKGDSVQLPIQEDETALILYSLWKHFDQHGDSEAIKKMYKKFIKPAGDFLVNFRDEKTKLPKESYDLWEEKLGIHTFTCSTVYAGLNAAKNFAEIFGNKTDASKYATAAVEVRQAMIDNLYDNESQVFLKGLYIDDDGNLQKDSTVDASTFYSLFEYNVLNIEDPRLTRTFELALSKLENHHGTGGIARYEGDRYYATAKDAPENPWFISTLWLAEYYIVKSKSVEDLKRAEEIFYFVCENALESGVLSEQLNPYTGKPLSVAPLTWSHAGFIIAVVKYLEKFEELSG